MPSITREQAAKRQAQAPTGWRYDIRHYVIWNENQLERCLNLPGDEILRATVYWRENYAKVTNDYGVSYERPVGTYSPWLHVAKWSKGSTPGIMTSSGIGKFRQLSEQAFERRNYKDLCKFAAAVTDDAIRNLHDPDYEL